MSPCNAIWQRGWPLPFLASDTFSGHTMSIHRHTQDDRRRATLHRHFQVSRSCRKGSLLVAFVSPLVGNLDERALSAFEIIPEGMMEVVDLLHRSCDRFHDFVSK